MQRHTVVSITDDYGNIYNKQIPSRPYLSFVKDNRYMILVDFLGNFLQNKTVNQFVNLGDKTLIVTETITPPSHFIVTEEELDEFEKALIAKSGRAFYVKDSYFNNYVATICSYDWNIYGDYENVLENEMRFYEYIDVITQEMINKKVENYSIPTITHRVMIGLVAFKRHAYHDMTILADFEKAEFLIDCPEIENSLPVILNWLDEEEHVYLKFVDEKDGKVLLSITNYMDLDPAWISDLDLEDL